MHIRKRNQNKIKRTELNGWGCMQSIADYAYSPKKNSMYLSLSKTEVATGKRNLSDIIPCQIGSADGQITTDSDLTYCIGKFCVNKS